MLPGHPGELPWERTLQGDEEPVAGRWVPQLAIAWICGLLPLMSGITIFLLWLVTDWDVLVAAGLLTIALGILLFVIGIVIAGIHLSMSRTASHPRAWLRPAVCALVLLLNFPVAATIVVAVVALATRYVVVVHNASSEPLDDVRVFGGGCDASLGSVPSGGNARSSLRFDHDGKLEFECRKGGKPVSTTVESYVTNGAGGRAEITVDEHAATAVSHTWDD